MKIGQVLKPTETQPNMQKGNENIFDQNFNSVTSSSASDSGKIETLKLFWSGLSSPRSLELSFAFELLFACKIEGKCLFICGLSRIMYDLVEAPNLSSLSTNTCRGLSGSKRMLPIKVPCAFIFFKENY